MDSPVSPSTPTKPLFSYQPGDEMSPEANRRAIMALQNAKDYTIEGENYEGQTMFDKLIIKEPLEFQNKSFMNHLQDIPYNETLLTKKVEEYFYTGLHLTFCRKRDDSLAIVSFDLIVGRFISRVFYFRKKTSSNFPILPYIQSLKSRFYAATKLSALLPLLLHSNRI